MQALRDEKTRPGEIFEMPTCEMASCPIGGDTTLQLSSGSKCRASDGRKIPKARRPTAGRHQALLAQAELVDHGFVALGIVLLEVVEQAPPLADQHEQTAARAVIFLVRFEVLRQLTDALA